MKAYESRTNSWGMKWLVNWLTNWQLAKQVCSLCESYVINNNATHWCTEFKICCDVMCKRTFANCSRTFVNTSQSSKKLFFAKYCTYASENGIQMYLSKSILVVMNYKMRHNENQPVMRPAKHSLTWLDRFFCYYLWLQKNRKTRSGHARLLASVAIEEGLVSI